MSLIPRPPPPQEALSITGNPKSFAILMRPVVSSGSISLAGITGTPALIAIFLASALFPNSLMVLGGGPIKLIPAFRQASAKSGFSDSKP